MGNYYKSVYQLLVIEQQLEPYLNGSGLRNTGHLYAPQKQNVQVSQTYTIVQISQQAIHI